MNTKIEKLNGEIEKTKAKIAEQQARLRDQERQKTEIENAEIVAIFRKEKLTEDDLAAFVRQMATRAQQETPVAAVEVSPAYQPIQEDYENEV